MEGLPLHLCDCLAPGILPAAINVVWVPVLYFGSRLSSHPAGQASSSWILWCPKECQKALVPVAAACFGWESLFLSLLFEFSIYSRLGQKSDLALCQQKMTEVLLLSGGKLRLREPVPLAPQSHTHPPLCVHLPTPTAQRTVNNHSFELCFSARRSIIC